MFIAFTLVVCAIVIVVPRYLANPLDAFFVLACYVLLLVVALVRRDWIATIIYSASLAFLIWLFWHHRGRRRGVGKQIGAKARAVRDRLVASMPARHPALGVVGA